MLDNNLLIIGTVWPEPKSSAAGSRMLQLIEVLQQAQYKITFACSSSKSKNSFSLQDIGIDEVTIELNNSSFDNFIAKLQPKIVMFDRFMIEEQYGWRVAEHCPNAFRILDTEDLHCLRKGRHQALKEGKTFDKNHLFNDTAKREIASIYRCDLSLIISEIEMDILINQFKIDTSLLCYLPFLLDDTSKNSIKQLPEFNERQHFITIGNFLHAPNYDAVLYLKHTIWPLIREYLPEAELHIYGAYASEKVNQLHNKKEGFLIKGFVDDVHQVMQNARVCLASLRFGAGLKGKLIDAMQNGTPSIITSTASEGMFGDLKPNGYIEDDAQQFANKAIELYKEHSLWNTFQSNGFEVIKERFNKKNFQKAFLSKLIESIQTLDKKRQNNFIGQMLQHHQLQSTKYMSKWIEEKNKHD